MAEAYSRNLLQVSLAQICQGLGWHAIQSTPCDILVDIMQRYIEKTGRLTARYAEQFGRTDANLDDLALAFQDMDVSLYEVENYLHDVEPTAFHHDIPKFPVPKKNNLQHPKPGTWDCRERLASIPEYMPPLVGVKEDFTPRFDRRDSTSFHLPIDSPELVSPSGQDKGEKRELALPDYEDYSTKRFRLDSEGNLQEVTIGGATPGGELIRVGKLPEAVTPPRRSSIAVMKTIITSKTTVEKPSALYTSLISAQQPKPKSPKQQKYGTQETKAPKAKMPASAVLTKMTVKAPTKSPKHNMFSPKATSHYPIKSKSHAVLGVLPQPTNKAVEVQPGFPPKSPHSASNTISTLLSAAKQIQETEVSKPRKGVRRDSAMSIYDFDDDFDGKSDRKGGKKQVRDDGERRDSVSMDESPFASSESKVDPNSPRLFDEYEVVSNTIPVAPGSSSDIKETEKDKLKTKKGKFKGKEKKKKVKGTPNPKKHFLLEAEKEKSAMNLFAPDIVVKSTGSEALKAKDVTSISVTPKVSKTAAARSLPPKLILKHSWLAEKDEDKAKSSPEEKICTPKIIIKPVVAEAEKKAPLQKTKSELALKKAKKLDKIKKKKLKLKKEKQKIKLGKKMAEEEDSLSTENPPPLKEIDDDVEEPVNKFNIVKSTKLPPFHIKISTPKPDIDSKKKFTLKEGDLKIKKTKKIKEDKKKGKGADEKKKSTKKSELYAAKQERVKEIPKLLEKPASPATPSAVPKITLKVGSAPGGSTTKIIIKTPVPPSPPPVSPQSPPPADSPESEPMDSPKPVPKISIPILPAKKSPKQRSPKAEPKTKTPKVTVKATKKKVATPPVSPPPVPSPTPSPPPKPAKESKSKKTVAKKAEVKKDEVKKVETKKTTAKKQESKKNEKKSDKSKPTVVKEEPKVTPPKPDKVKTKASKKERVMKGVSVKKEKNLAETSPEPVPGIPPKKTDKEQPRTVITETLGTFISETGKKIWICPACKMRDDGSAMVGCDDCDDWYHWPCVGLLNEPEEDNWYCDRCLAVRRPAKGKKRTKKK